MNDEIYTKICSIQLKNDTWHFYDCNDNELPTPSNKRIFSSSMKRRYLTKWNDRQNDRQNDTSTIWVLVGYKKNNEEKFEQVGRTKDLINSLNEIRENVKDFFGNDNSKYGKLKRKGYTEIVFYEVNIDDYLQDDRLFVETYGKPPTDGNLSSAYYFLRAAYVEGKIGVEKSPNMYHPSSLDGFFYSYFIEVKKDSTNKCR